MTETFLVGLAVTAWAVALIVGLAWVSWRVVAGVKVDRRPPGEPRWTGEVKKEVQQWKSECI